MLQNGCILPFYRRLGVTSQALRNDRRRFKYYYNNRFGYKRHFEFRGYYYQSEIDNKVPLKDKVWTRTQPHNSWRIRNKTPQPPIGKWEMTSEKKRRLVDLPEFHPALDSRVPQFRFADGTPQPTPNDAQIEAEKNRILVRQIVEMYKHLDLNDTNLKETRKQEKAKLIQSQPAFKEKGSVPPPL